MISHWLQKQWLDLNCWHVLLLPLSWIFGLVVSVRSHLYKKAWFNSHRLPVPVIVVGNINVGGTGKTPLVIWLAEQLTQVGYKPGIISRGYGGSVNEVTEVFADSNPATVGDESVLIALRTSCPMFVSANRVQAGLALLKAHPECNIIISDDGLQHYRLQRDVEIVVVDSVKGFGNGALLPAGPLRESINRMSTVDCLVSNGGAFNIANLQSGLQHLKTIEMQLTPSLFYKLIDRNVKSDASMFKLKKVKAIAGIGSPQRFFQQLKSMGIESHNVAYADHHAFVAKDIEDLNAEFILMTEKDAVKCRSFAKPNCWVLPINAEVNDDLLKVVLNKLNKVRK